MKASTKKLLMYGAIGYAAFWLYKKKQAIPVAVASATTPSTAVSPTAAPTTTNMQALAGLGKMLPEGAQYYSPEGVQPIIGSVPKPRQVLSGGYNLPAAVPVRNAVRYPAPSPFQRYN